MLERIHCWVNNHKWLKLEEYKNKYNETVYILLCEHCGKLIYYIPSEFFKQIKIKHCNKEEIEELLKLADYEYFN